MAAPNITNPTATVAESDTLMQLYSEKMSALHLKQASDDFGLQIPHTILTSLYRKNEAIARVTLYKDYANDYARRPEKWGQLSVDIQRYGKYYASLHDRFRDTFLLLIPVLNAEKQSADQRVLEEARRSHLALAENVREGFDKSELDLLRLAARIATIEAQGHEMDESNAELNASISALFGNSQDLEHYARETKARKELKGKTLLSRLWFALFGGLTLIVSTIIMAVVSDYIILVRLLTISVFTLAVAVILAMTLRTADSRDIIFATSAYAAVLVIFLGSAGIHRSGVRCFDADDNVTLCLPDGTNAAIVIGVLVGTVIIIIIGARIGISAAGLAHSGGVWKWKMPSTTTRMPFKRSERGRRKHEQAV